MTTCPYCAPDETCAVCLEAARPDDHVRPAGRYVLQGGKWWRLLPCGCCCEQVGGGAK